MNEECWFIRGKHIGPIWVGKLEYHSMGGLAHVDFNWQEAQRNDLLGFFHSHPNGLCSPSSRDDRTMRAWVKSEGRPLLCGIFCSKDDACYLYEKRNGKIESYAMFGKVFNKDILIAARI